MRNGSDRRLFPKILFFPLCDLPPMWFAESHMIQPGCLKNSCRKLIPDKIPEILRARLLKTSPKVAQKSLEGFIENSFKI